MKIYSVPIYQSSEGPLCEKCNKEEAKWMRCAYNNSDGSLVVKKELCGECPFEIPIPEINIPVEIEKEGRRLKLQIISDDGLDFDINVALNFKPDNDKLWESICKELMKQEKIYVTS